MSDNVIGKQQSCGTSRSLFNNLILMREIILKFVRTKETAAILSVDFMQALNRSLIPLANFRQSGIHQRIFNGSSKPLGRF